MLVTLFADSYESYPWYAEIASMLMLFLIISMPVINFVMLYIKLLPIFIKGIRKGGKFEQFNKEESKIEVINVVLSDGHGAGRISYDAPMQSDINVAMREVNNNEDNSSVSNVPKTTSDITAGFK